MSDTIVSKNLFDLLGNDEDGEGTVPIPVKAPIDKTAPRHGKRNVPEAAPKTTINAPRRQKEEVSGNEKAFRDRDAGRSVNRDRPADDGTRGRGRGRGDGRGRGRGRGPRQGQYGDRFSRGIGGVSTDHEKQAAHGWGANTGDGEWNDEKAGEAIAQQERKENVEAVGEEAVEEAAAAEDAAPPVEEDKSKSYDDYLAEQAAKKLQLGGPLEARRANEGAGKSFEKGTAIDRENNDDYFIGGEGKAGRQRERKEKNVLALDHDIQIREREREASRGGRGGRGRGRGDGPPRARGGAPRGAAGRGRGGATPNVLDTSAFPSLGGS